ncbi:MAG: DUF3576 domain-containing protein [Alphaproteobacteria bacterium]|nr:DUF3576 domain-containing protein [Alphaproteobacteria bacterium SS10]
MLGICALALAACSSDLSSSPDQEFPGQSPYNSPSFQGPEGSLLGGEGGISFFGGGNDAPAAGGGAGLGVNAFLWRASLDTVSFLPVTSADPFGGVIITDWYSPADAQNERFKLNIYILDRQLRADGLRVAVFREVRTPDGWTSAEVADGTSGRMEDAILTRARQLRVSQQASN